ncbi:MAG: hypothetical protein O3A00_13030, partial [Planctomycetota bacterium]|nr:hypothetical protein [Planctomycetota bacterium]
MANRSIESACESAWKLGVVVLVLLPTTGCTFSQHGAGSFERELKSAAPQRYAAILERDRDESASNLLDETLKPTPRAAIATNPPVRNVPRQASPIATIPRPSADAEVVQRVIDSPARVAASPTLNDRIAADPGRFVFEDVSSPPETLFVREADQSDPNARSVADAYAEAQRSDRLSLDEDWKVPVRSQHGSHTQAGFQSDVPKPPTLAKQPAELKQPAPTPFRVPTPKVDQPPRVTPKRAYDEEVVRERRIVETIAELKPITSISIDTRPKEDPESQNELKFPADKARSIFEQHGSELHTTGTSRPWMMSEYRWDAPAMRHNPLYFEQ